jgi:hypothetical protein
MPVYSAGVFSSGKYQSQLNLGATLKSDQPYSMWLLIGYKEEAGSGSGVVSESGEGMGVPTYAPESSGARPVTASTSSAVVIDSGRPFYQGYKSISPSDMAGKSAINVVIELTGFGIESEDLPAQITTEGTDVDVKVEAVFKDSAANNTETGPF